MALKNKVQVIIEGKILTLMGTEPEQYLKNVASYIDTKMTEIRKSQSSQALSASMVSVLTSINIADDFFKEVDKTKALTQELEKIKALSFDEKKAKEEYMEKVDALTEEITQLKKDAAQAVFETETVSDDVSDETIVEYEAKITQLEMLNQSLQEKIDILEDIKKSSLEKITLLEEEKKTETEKLETLAKENMEKKDVIDRLNKQVQEQKETLETLEKETEQQKETIHKLEEDNKLSEEIIQVLESEKSDLIKELDRCTNALEASTNHNHPNRNGYRASMKYKNQ